MSGAWAAFRGPYRVTTVLPMSCAQQLASLVQRRASPLFSTAEQAALPNALHAIGYEARFIRKGRLITLALLGASD